MQPVEGDELSRRFRAFATSEARGSSPLYERLCAELADEPLVGELYADVDSGQRRPNLLLAALHAEVLGGARHDLARYYPSAGGDRPPDDALAGTAVDFLREHLESLRSRMAERHTQTNEVRRSAVLLAALNQVRWRGEPALVDVGASAGLNLLVDRYGYDYGRGLVLGADRPVRVRCDLVGDGVPEPLEAVRIADRIGIDLKPLSVTDSEDVLWLRACVWPEHHRRHELLEAAIREAQREPPPVVRGEAIDTLSEVVAGLPADRHVVVFHSATLAYMPAEARERFEGRVETLARQRNLSWIPMEGVGGRYARLERDHRVQPPVDTTYFLVGLTDWSAGQREDRLLARADPHGGWMQWLAA